MTTAIEHPFAPYVRILGKGKQGSRSLDRDEARIAFGMILDGEALDVQLGAFLMLLRVKEETPDELAGFVDAVRSRIPPLQARIDIDWSSYAGKRRHAPWFILSWLLLSQAGYRLAAHGASGHTAGRLYTEETLRALGFNITEDLAQLDGHINRQGFAYVPLRVLAPRLADLIDLRNIMGLRSPVHSLARLINPFNAPTVLQGIFHPPYAGLHQQAAHLLGYTRTLVLKGEGGEIECNPDVGATVRWAHDGAVGDLDWPALFTHRHVKPAGIEPEDLARLWRGEADDEYGEGAVISTTALALYGAGAASGRDDALHQARELWQKRDRGRL